MKKLLSLSLAILMLFAFIPAAMTASAAVETYYLDGSQIGMTWTQKISSANKTAGTAGDYETDGYTKYLSGCTSTGKMVTVYFPESIYDEEGLTSLTISLRAGSGTFKSKSYKPYIAKAGTAYSYQSGSYTDGDDIETRSAYDEVTTTSRVFTFDFTTDAHADMLTKKCNVFAFPVYTNASNGTFYVDYISYTIESNAAYYAVTVDGEEVASVKEGKTYTVPTPATGYHYTDGTTDYVGGEEITVTGPVALTSVINIYDVTVDGDVVASVEYGDNYTVPTPATGYEYTDGTTIYVGGEEIAVTGPVALTTKLQEVTATYTMDEGSRMVEAKTYGVYASNVGTYGDFEYRNIGTEEEPNYVLKMPIRTDQYSYFKLPSNWAVKPGYKATNISFEISKPEGTVAIKSQIALADAVGDKYKPSGNIVNIFETNSSAYLAPSAETFSVDVTEDMYDYTYILFNINGNNSTSSADNNVCVYIDNVTVTFEYDPDYVAPEEDGLTTDAIATQDSASIRINEVSGMRFYTTVDTEALADLGEVTERGTIIGPADKVGTYLTIEDTVIPEGKKAGNAVAVKYDLAEALWINGDNYEMVGSLVGILEKNYTRDFVARAYVVVDGVYYYSKTTAIKNVADIADQCVGTDFYNGLTVANQSLVDTWAAAND